MLTVPGLYKGSIQTPRNTAGGRRDAIRGSGVPLIRYSLTPTYPQGFVRLCLLPDTFDSPVLTAPLFVVEENKPEAL